MLRKPLLAVTTALALATPAAAVTASTAAESRALPSEMALDDAASDVWTYSEGTSEWELWGTKADADVLAAEVKHGAKAIRVVMSFDDLRKKRPASYLARIKTKKLVRTAWVGASEESGWGGRHGLQRGLDKVPSPGLKHEIDYQADTVVMIIPRELVKDPAWIQVKLSNHLTGDRLFTDNPHNGDDQPTLSEKLYKP